MKITVDTPISALMNYEKVSSLCDQFSSKVNSFKETSSGVLEEEMRTGLSSENCLVKGSAILEDSGSSTLLTINNIDTSILSEVVAKAKEKRIEELSKLRTLLKVKILTLTIMRDALKSIENPTPEQVSRIRELNADISKYETKLDEVIAELGIM